MTDRELLISIRYQINERLSYDPVIKIDAGFTENGSIWVTWTHNYETSLDILYYSPEHHEEWEHSYAEYVAPINSTHDNESVIIDVGYSDDWKLKIVDMRDNWESGIISISKKKVKKPLQSLWDSWHNDYQDFDMVKIGKWDDIQEQYDKGKTLIISASHTWYKDDELKPEHKWRSKLEQLRDNIKDLDTNRYFIFLQDEPLGSDVWGEKDEDKLSNLNRLINLAKEILPDGVRLGMSFTNGSVLWKDLPTELHFYLTPNYPFKTQWAVENGHKDIKTKQEYFEDTKQVIDSLRSKVGGDKIIGLIGQGFFNTGTGDVKPHEKRWGKPPLEYIQWLYGFCEKYGIEIVIWWAYFYDRNHYLFLKDMPEMYERIKS